MSVTIDLADDLCITINEYDLYVSSSVKLSRQALADRIKRIIRRGEKEHVESMTRMKVALMAVANMELKGDVL